jgi:metal-sulfur cluster biosynthetic enzyme
VECRSSSFAIEEVNVATEVLNEEIARSALRQVKDPELEMNIVELGLVYDVEIEDGSVRVRMTLTSPGCPAGPMITNDAYRVLRALDGVKDVNIDIVWEPYWTPERIDPKVRALLGL